MNDPRPQTPDHCSLALQGILVKIVLRSLPYGEEMTREVKRTDGLGAGPERYIAACARRYSRLRIAGSADGVRQTP